MGRLPSLGYHIHRYPHWSHGFRTAQVDRVLVAPPWNKQFAVQGQLQVPWSPLFRLKAMFRKVISDVSSMLCPWVISYKLSIFLLVMIYFCFPMCCDYFIIYLFFCLGLNPFLTFGWWVIRSQLMSELVFIYSNWYSVPLVKNWTHELYANCTHCPRLMI